ncbi:Transposon Polyprotein integrase [Phytophthora megakarya]|uniref:Transposon Polyprotein integrase n=1 Tax=Phytophthora megakarya TaxID=4795 RepID=A0A225UXX4_9STRA|nr:Transposon Polyprotein integrase [Phytophthora megakarya]
MVDRDLVDGMMLRQRSFDDCEACHMGKEWKPAAKKKLDREIERKNQVIFADLLFPEPKKATGNQKPVLVIIDDYTRYTTVYPLKSKEASEVNPAMQRYIEWADRQFPDFDVKKVITDGGREFTNDKMTKWYLKKGIEFLPNPPKSSHLNPCERVHQTLIHMLKAMLSTAGLPMSFWMHALKMAVYV